MQCVLEVYAVNKRGLFPITVSHPTVRDSSERDEMVVTDSEKEWNDTERKGADGLSSKECGKKRKERERGGREVSAQCSVRQR